MIINDLEVTNFRNINKLNFSFNKNINIFIGNNAQGKTNILESIYFLAITKSHRTNNELNMIKKDCLYTKIQGSFVDDKQKLSKLSIILNEKGKKVSVDNIIQKRISNYLSRLNVIMFCPDDLEIIKGSPSIRRRFLNIEISQINNNYLQELKNYGKILKQRNEYLKQKNNAKFNRMYFDIITKNLVTSNINLISKRYDFIDSLNTYLPFIFNELGGTGKLKIIYKSFIKQDELENENIHQQIFNKYENIFTNELLQKTTLLGCHKDDFKLVLDGFDVSEFCSQGQQRLATLCLKLAEIEVFKIKNNIYPIILLDDIFSELDEAKKNNIIKYFNDDVQIFITTTDIKDINDGLKRKSDIYIVDNGTFKKED